MTNTIQITEDENEMIRAAFDTFEKILTAHGMASLHSKLHGLTIIRIKNAPDYLEDMEKLAYDASKKFTW